jgi:hypothetical protein
LTAAVGLAFDDQFVCGGGEPVDGRQERVGHDGQPLSGLWLEVTTVAARWWRATMSS